jgi:DNA primase
MNIVEAVGLRYKVVGSGRWRRTLEHDSLVIDSERNLFHWNSRGISGDVKYFLVNFVGMKPTSAESIAEPVKDLKLSKKDVALNPSLAKLYWEYGKDFRELWYARGFTDKTIDKYRLGYFAGFYTLPFYVNGNVKAILMRDKNKYFKEAKGSVVSLFGYDQLDPDIKKVLLVESVMDVPILSQYGFNAVSHNYGNMVWDDSWIPLLNDYEIYFVPDNDRAGNTSIKNVTISCNVISWPDETPYGFDIGKLYMNNPFKFESNVTWLIDNSIPIEFLTYV